MAGFPQVGDTFGDFVVESVLGHGGMGVVFRARHVRLNRPVALKVLSPVHAHVEEYRARFIREAGILAAMDSPHIVGVYDHGEQDGCLFIATQLINGGDLSDRLDTRGPLRPGDACEVAAQLATALADAHAAGVVHRDVKPKNVLLRDGDDRPQSYLCDFGIARGAEDQITQTGMIVGTYGYLAPERCEGADATPASDIYSLGCVLVAMLTGSAPYTGTDMQVVSHHLHSPVPQLAAVTPEIAALNAVIARSMAKNPAERYGSARDMRAALRQIQDLGRTAATVPQERLLSPITPTTPMVLPPLLARPPRSTGRLFALIGIPVVLLAVIGTALALTLGGNGDSPAAKAASGKTSTSGAGKTPSKTASPTPSTTASTPVTHVVIARKTCWDGSAISSTQPCSLPHGYAGMRYVFPSYAAQSQTHPCTNQTGVLRNEPGKELSLSCTGFTAPDGTSFSIVYGGWRSWSACSAHYVAKYGTNGAVFGDLLLFAPAHVGHTGAADQTAMMYRTRLPYSVTVIATTESAFTYGEAQIQHVPLNSVQP